MICNNAERRKWPANHANLREWEGLYSRSLALFAGKIRIEENAPPVPQEPTGRYGTGGMKKTAGSYPQKRKG